jgi:hypothetical protein
LAGTYELDDNLNLRAYFRRAEAFDAALSSSTAMIWPPSTPP